MAQTANSFMAKSCLLKIILTIVIIILLVVAAYFVVGNMTLEQMGLADKEIGGTTLRELGLHDIKIKDFVSLMKSIAKPDEGAILDNKPDADDKTSGSYKMTEAGLSIKANGEPDYLKLLDTPITGTTQKKVVLSDRELAAMFTAMVDEAGENADADLKTVKELDAKVEQITVTKEEGGAATVEILLYIDVSSLSDDLKFVNKLKFIPSKIYLNCVNKLSVDNNGIISMVSNGLEINGMGDEFVSKIINAIYKKVIANQELTEAQKSKTPEQFINDSVGAVFKKTVNNIGLVGTAGANEYGNVIPESIIYGNGGIIEETTSGLKKNYISLITRKE